MRFLLLALIILTQCAWSTGWQQDQSVNNLQISGKLSTYQATAPTATSCGTNPSVTTTSSDMSGTITFGTGSVTSCRLAFNTAYLNAPNCFIINKTANPFVTAETATTDTAALYFQSFGTSNLAGTTASYLCVQNQ